RVAGGIEADALRCERSGPGPGRKVRSQEHLRAEDDLRLEGIQATGAGGGLDRGRLEAQNLVNVGLATGRAGKAEAEGARQVAVGRLDVRVGEHVLEGAAVVAVREGQQAVLRDVQVVHDGLGAIVNRGDRLAA